MGLPKQQPARHGLRSPWRAACCGCPHLASCVCLPAPRPAPAASPARRRGLAAPAAAAEAAAAAGPLATVPAPRPACCRPPARPPRVEGGSCCPWSSCRRFARARLAFGASPVSDSLLWLSSPDLSLPLPLESRLRARRVPMADAPGDPGAARGGAFTRRVPAIGRSGARVHGSLGTGRGEGERSCVGRPCVVECSPTCAPRSRSAGLRVRRTAGGSKGRVGRGGRGAARAAAGPKPGGLDAELHGGGYTGSSTASVVLGVLARRCGGTPNPL